MDQSHIEHCPNCKGWGTTKTPITDDFTICESCSGYGTQMHTQYFTLYLGIPNFFDFRSDKKKLFIKLGIGILSILFLAALIGVIYILVRGLN